MIWCNVNVYRNLPKKKRGFLVIIASYYVHSLYNFDPCFSYLLIEESPFKPICVHSYAIRAHRIIIKSTNTPISNIHQKVANHWDCYFRTKKMKQKERNYKKKCSPWEIYSRSKERDFSLFTIGPWFYTPLDKQQEQYHCAVVIVARATKNRFDWKVSKGFTIDTTIHCFWRDPNYWLLNIWYIGSDLFNPSYQ